MYTALHQNALAETPEMIITSVIKYIASILQMLFLFFISQLAPTPVLLLGLVRIPLIGFLNFSFDRSTQWIKKYHDFSNECGSLPISSMRGALF